jgi:hypothetical protein
MILMPMLLLAQAFDPTTAALLCGRADSVTLHGFRQPELYVKSPNPKAGIILGDIFPRMGDFIATDKFAICPRLEVYVATC